MSRGCACSVCPEALPTCKPSTWGGAWLAAGRTFSTKTIRRLAMRMIRSMGFLALGVSLSSCGGEGAGQAAHPVGSANKLFADAPGDPAHNLLQQSDFEDGVMLPWMASFGNGAKGSAAVKD